MTDELEKEPKVAISPHRPNTMIPALVSTALLTLFRLHINEFRNFILHLAFLLRFDKHHILAHVLMIHFHYLTEMKAVRGEFAIAMVMLFQIDHQIGCK